MGNNREEVDIYLSDDLNLGVCCACRDPKVRTRTVLMVAKRAPVPGTGWGCLECGLPSDGAVAVLCDPCVNAGHPPRDVCIGDASDGLRVPIDELVEEFDHKEGMHVMEGAFPPDCLMRFNMTEQPTLDTLRTARGIGMGTIGPDTLGLVPQSFCFTSPATPPEGDDWPVEWEYWIVAVDGGTWENREIIGRLHGQGVSWERVVLHAHTIMYQHVRKLMGKEVYPQ